MFEEIQRFNRKLRKIMKRWGNVRVIEVESERDYFTNHGLHMNLKGRERTAQKIGTEIAEVLSENKSTAIIMVGKDEIATEKVLSHTHVRKDTLSLAKKA
jgi:hypothetical protein